MFFNEDIIDNSIGCNTENTINNSCLTRIIDQFFDLGNFFSKENLLTLNINIKNIYLGRINKKLNSNILNNNYLNGNKTNKSLLISDINENNDKNPKFPNNKKIYAFPDIKELFFEKFINDKYNNLSNSIKNEYDIMNEIINNKDILFNNLNPNDFIEKFLDNIINIDTNVQIEINLNSIKKNEEKTSLSSSNIEVKNPINTLEIKKETENFLIKLENITANNFNNITDFEEPYLNNLTENDKEIKKTINSFNSNNEAKNENEKYIKENNLLTDHITNQEIFYNNRDNNRPFIDINPKASTRMFSKIKNSEINKFKSEQSDTTIIILINFENLSRKKFKNKFPFVYKFINKFYKIYTENNHNYDINNINEQKKIDYQKTLVQNIQAYQSMKYLPNYFNSTIENNFKNYQNFIKRLDNLNYLTLYATTDIEMSEVVFNKTKNIFEKIQNKISRNFLNILNLHDRIILENLYNNFENLIIKENYNDNKILSEKNLILDYSKKFISEFPNNNKFINLKFDQSSYSKELDKQIFLWLKDVVKILENKKFIFVFYSSVSEEKPFYINEFSDIFTDEIERKSMMLLNIFPSNKFDTNFHEILKINENMHLCECDLLEMINYIASDRENNYFEKISKNKDIFNGN